MNKYLISVRTLNGTILYFKVYDYEIVDNLVTFEDEKKDKLLRRYPVKDCNIEEVTEK